MERVPVLSRAGSVCRQPGAKRQGFACIRWFMALTALFCAASPCFADAFVPRVVPFHTEHGFAVVVPVSINDRGPYPFLLDTGATVTALDRELAQQVAVDIAGKATVTTLVEQMPVSLAIARTVNVGPVREHDVAVMIRDLRGLQAFAPGIRGVLGQNALNHADFLLDYRHKRVEFDVDGTVLSSLNGHRLPLRREAMDASSTYANLAVRAAIAGDGAHAMDFLLDSGTASVVLFNSEWLDAQSAVKDTAGAEATAMLRTEQLVIDGRSKTVPTHTIRSHVAGPRIGGLLPTYLFARLYISNSGGFAIFEPKERRRDPMEGAMVDASLGPRMSCGME